MNYYVNKLHLKDYNAVNLATYQTIDGKQYLAYGCYFEPSIIDYDKIGRYFTEESLKKLDYLMHDYDIHVFRANEYYINDKPLCQLRCFELNIVDTEIE